MYRDATERPYGYLMFDLHPNSSDHERLKTNLLRSEGYTTVYQKKNRLKKISSNPSHRIAVCEQTGGGGGGGGGRRAAAGDGRRRAAAEAEEEMEIIEKSHGRPTHKNTVIHP